jgi:hypothetical protein
MIVELPEYRPLLRGVSSGMRAAGPPPDARELNGSLGPRTAG